MIHPANILPMFPGEHHFTNRKTAANLSTGPEFVPEATMWLDAMPDEYGPTVNMPAPWDDALEGVSTIVIGLWAVFLCLGLVLAMIYVPAWGAGQ